MIPSLFNRLILSTFEKEEMTETPHAMDICCGRGKGRWNSPGNRKFKELVLEYLEQYQAAPSKAEKSKVVETVVKVVQRQGGRFVRHDEKQALWFEIGPSERRAKVAHCIRDHLATTKRNLVGTSGRTSPLLNKSKQARRKSRAEKGRQSKQNKIRGATSVFQQEEVPERSPILNAQQSAKGGLHQDYLAASRLSFSLNEQPHHHAVMHNGIPGSSVPGGFHALLLESQEPHGSAAVSFAQMLAQKESDNLSANVRLGGVQLQNGAWSQQFARNQQTPHQMQASTVNPHFPPFYPGHLGAGMAGSSSMEQHLRANMILGSCQTGHSMIGINNLNPRSAALAMIEGSTPESAGSMTNNARSSFNAMVGDMTGFDNNLGRIPFNEQRYQSLSFGQGNAMSFREQAISSADPGAVTSFVNQEPMGVSGFGNQAQFFGHGTVAPLDDDIEPIMVFPHDE